MMGGAFSAAVLLETKGKPMNMKSSVTISVLAGIAIMPGTFNYKTGIVRWRKHKNTLNVSAGFHQENSLIISQNPD